MKIQLPNLTITKKRLIILFVSSIVMLLIISTILRVLTPQAPPLQGVVQNEKKFEPVYSFKNIDISLPERMSVYTIQQRIPTLQEKATVLAQQLTLQPSQDLENYWFNEDKTQSLRFSLDGSKLIYSEFDLLSSPSAQKRIVNKSKAIQTAQSYLEIFGYKNNFSLSEAQPVFLDEAILKKTDIGNANYFLFEAKQRIEEYPLVSQTKTDPPFVILIHIDGKFYQARFYPQVSELKKIQSHSILDIEEIKNNIQQHKGIFIKTANLEHFIPDPTDLVQVTLTQAQLEYRINEQNGYVLPYIRFSGTGTDNEENTFSIELITPAIEVEGY